MGWFAHKHFRKVRGRLLMSRRLCNASVPREKICLCQNLLKPQSTYRKLGCSLYKGLGIGKLGANLGYLESPLVRTCIPRGWGSTSQSLTHTLKCTCTLNFVSSTKVNYLIKFKTNSFKKKYKWDCSGCGFTSELHLFYFH